LYLLAIFVRSLMGENPE